MKLTAQEEFGLRCIVRIAQGHRSGLLKISEIAKSESLTVEYVAKLMRILRIAGLVQSIRGQKGGYCLTRTPEEIDLAQIFDALGNRFFTPESCGRYRGKRRRCAHNRDCSVRPVLVGVDGLITALLQQVTLSDLLSDEAEMRRRINCSVKRLPTVVSSSG